MNTLVFVHGFMGSANNWAPTVHRLQGSADFDSTRWKMLTIDLLGHGQRVAESRGQKLTLDVLTHDLASQIESETFFALGHSFGLRPLLRMTELYPGRLSHLIVEDASPSLSTQGFEELKDTLSIAKDFFPSRESARAVFEKRFGVASRMSRFLLSHIRELEPGRHGWRFDVEALGFLLKEAYENPLWTPWKTFSGPLAMIVGENSSGMTESRVKECVDVRLPKMTELVQIEQSGHWVHSDQAEKFCLEVVKILNRWI